MSAYWSQLVAASLEADRTRHRPASPDAIAVEVRRLAGSGLMPHDIAGALQINVAEVLRLIAHSEGAA